MLDRFLRRSAKKNSTAMMAMIPMAPIELPTIAPAKRVGLVVSDLVATALDDGEADGSCDVAGGDGAGTGSWVDWGIGWPANGG